MNGKKLKTQRIISVVTNDLVGDQRVHKTALTLQAAGFDLWVAGRLLPGSPEVERPYRISRLRLCFKKGPLFYAAYSIRMFLFLLFRRADCLLANDLDTLPAVWAAARLRRIPFVIDCHEYFTEVPELVHRPGVQRVWKCIERHLLPRAHGLITVNRAIADLFAAEYGREAVVIMNLPLRRDPGSADQQIAIPDTFHGKKMILYQGAVNVGRGLEEMIRALPLLPAFFLVIAGSGDLLDELKKLVHELNLEGQVWFTGRLPFSKLSGLTSQAVIGISLEQDLGLNYRLALPNKVFDYMHAGLPVLASDLPVMGELVRMEQTGERVSRFDPLQLSQQILTMTGDEKKMEGYRQAARQAAEKYHWERQEASLTGLFRQVLKT